MSDNEYNHELFSLERQIKEELQLMEINLDALSDEDFGSRDLFTEYQQKLRFIHDLFDRASEYIRELVLDQENPQLYALLECKQNIHQHYGLYRYLLNRLNRQFGRDVQEREDELERTHEPESLSEQEEEDEEEPVVSEEPDRAEMEAAILAAEEEAAREEEKAAKKRKLEKQRREKLLKSRKAAEEKAEREREALLRDRQGENSGFQAVPADFYQRQMEQRRYAEQGLREEQHQSRPGLEQQYTEHRRAEDPARSLEQPHSAYSQPEQQRTSVYQDEYLVQEERNRRQREEYQRQVIESQREHTESRSSTPKEQMYSQPQKPYGPVSGGNTPDASGSVRRYESQYSRPESPQSRDLQSSFPDGYRQDPSTQGSQNPPFAPYRMTDAPRPYDQTDRRSGQTQPAPYTSQEERDRRQREEHQRQAFESKRHNTESRGFSSHLYSQPAESYGPLSDSKAPGSPESVHRHEGQYSRPESPQSRDLQSAFPDGSRQEPNTPGPQTPHFEQRRMTDDPRPYDQTDRRSGQAQPAPYTPQDDLIRTRNASTNQGREPYPFSSNAPRADFNQHRQYEPDTARPEPKTYPERPVSPGGDPVTQGHHEQSYRVPPQAPPPHKASHGEAQHPQTYQPQDVSGNQAGASIGARPEPMGKDHKSSPIQTPSYTDRRNEPSQSVVEQHFEVRREGDRRASYQDTLRAHPSQPTAPRPPYGQDTRQSNPASRPEAFTGPDGTGQPKQETSRSGMAPPIAPFPHHHNGDSGQDIQQVRREDSIGYDDARPAFPQSGFQRRHENFGSQDTPKRQNNHISQKESPAEIGDATAHHDPRSGRREDPYILRQDTPRTREQASGGRTDPIPRNHDDRSRRQDPKPKPKDTENTRNNEVKPKDPKNDGTVQPKTFYHFVPGGIAETQLRKQALASLSEKHASASLDNHRIFSAIKDSGSTPGKPQLISPAYVTQMRFNLDRAKIAYQEAQGTAEAKQAAHQYMSQRSAYMKLRSEIRRGNIQVERPKVMTTKAASRQEKAANNSTVLYHFTPSGVQGQLIENAVLTGTAYELRRHGKRPVFNYTKANPLVVNPAYESALKARVDRASVALNHAVAASHAKGKTVRVNPALNDEVKVATAAYIGFLRAKQGGQVIVSDRSDHRNPDYEVWSQQYRHSRSGRPNPDRVKGETAQVKGANPNKFTKESVEEVTANILGKSVKLKRQKAVVHYMKMAGYRVDGYTSMALSRASRKFYYMLQNGDEDAPESIRTFEQGRYYITSAVGVAGAIKNFHVANSKGAAKLAGKAEQHRFSQYYFQDQRALSRQIHQDIKNNRLLKKDIKELMKQGSSLSPEQRKELLSKMKELAKSSHETTKAVAFRDLQRKNLNLIKASKDLENRRKVITTRAKIDETIETIRHQQEKKMAKKFGSLMTVTDKSLAQQIQQMTTQGRELKQQIKLLQGKGSLLTTGERKQLMKLMKKHQALMAELKQYAGLRDARRNLKAMLSPYMDMRKTIIKNSNAWSNGSYALYGFISRGLRQSGDIGILGIAKAADIATNRYVRILVKKSFKLSFSTAKWLSDKTGLTKVVKKAGRATQQVIVQSAPAQSIKTGVSATKATIKTAVDTTKTAAVRMTPDFVKTGVAKGAKGKTLIKDFSQRTQKRIAESTLGRSVSAVYRNASKFTSAITHGLSVLKGFLVKGALFVVGAILIFGLIIGVVEVIASSASSIIMGMDEEDGKIDLTPYVEIINDLENEFDLAIELLQNSGSYDNVYINYVTDTMDNTKEMLSMLAVRTNQDLSTSNPLVKQYLKSLYHDSHTYVTSEDEYDCSGCETRTIKVDKIDPETGQVVLDAQSGRPVKEEVEEEYCPGHVDLFIDISILGFDAIFGADSLGNFLEGDAVAGELIGNATITYYCIEPYAHICNDGTADTTASGTTPTPGRTIAVDPSRIPLGSHVIIDGHEYIAEDTGGAIDSLDIDIVVATHEEALRKGTRENIPVYWAARDGEGIKDTGEWNGWTKDNIEWCKVIYQQDWSDLYTGLGLEGFAPALNDEELQAVLDGLPDNLSETRRNIIQSGLSGIGRIRYNWGGKPNGPGLSGLPATGLDCSGFITWAYMTAGVPRQNWYGGGTGAINSSSSMTQISHSSLKPGDLGFKHVGGSASSSNANHVGIYIGKNSSGKDVWLHCASGSGATINTYGGFTVYFRSTAFN